MSSLQQQLEASLAGRYEIEREIGAGGMATVYLARDIKHQRNVAVKLLNPELGAVIGVDRFLSEIRVTANLQHPNLLPLFDSGEANGLLFYVMPYVEGESLRARLDREKQLPIDEAVRIASAIASALDYAHRHGVIHRDLKPENILIHDGQPLIADFGIALALSNAGGQRVTQTGLSLGTPQYMSPEQATGDRGIDGRTDIYSLGALTYEMLTGEAPHTGTNAQAIIAKLMTERPRPITALRKSVPSHVDAAVQCALEKLPADRFPTAKDFADALNGKSGALPTSAMYETRAAGTRRTSPALLALVALVAATGGALTALALRAKPPAHSVEFRLSTSGAESIFRSGGWGVTFSPDGQAVAYVAQGQGQGIIMLRRLDSERPRPLAGTDGAQDIHFSPDSKRIAYFKNGAIWLAAFDGSAPTELLTIGAWNGITWTGPKEIVYEVSDTLWSVDVGSRAKRIVTTLDLATKEVDLNGPFGLPDGKTVAFIVSDRHDWTGVNHLAFVATDGSHRTVTPIVTRWVAAYHDGWLFYASEAKALTAIRIDLSGHASSDPVQLMDTTQVSSGRTALSAGGDLAFVRGATEREIAIFGPRGESLTGLHEGQFYTTPTWSPDGRRVAFVMPVPGASASATGIWIFDPAAGRSARLSTRKSALRPAWSPDGKQLAFIGVGDSAQSFQSAWTIAADGSGGEKLLYSTAGRVREVVYTPDGRSVVMTVDATATPKNGRDLVVMSLGDSKVTPIVATSADEYQPAVSSDGRWLAYTSNESGKPEVYVRPMNGSGSSAVMSKGGGAEPRWTHDGRIVYRSSSAAFYRVTLTTVGGLAAAGQRDSLLLPSAIRYDMHQNYDIAGDGRYVVVRNANSDADVFVVTNWWEKVKDRLK